MNRVLFVSTSTTLGGAEKTLYTLATLLDPKRFHVAGAVSLKPAGVYAQRLAAGGIPSYSLELKGRPSLGTVKELTRIIDQHHPDIVHALMYQAIQVSRLAKRRARWGFKLVSSPRVSYRVRPAWSLWIDRLLKGGDDLLIAESKSSRDYLIKNLKYSPQKVKTIYNGVDIAQWPISKTDRQQKRLELRLAADDILVGSIGRLDAQKGHGVLLEAMAKLKDSRPAVRCVILGDGPRREALRAQIRLLSLEENVWLLGERPDATAWLSSFDVFALPSLWEGLPNALLEAMALGIAPVASAVDGVGEVVTDGQNGLLVPPRDAAALAGKISALSADPALRERLGQAAKKTVAERFSLLSMIAGYEAAYAEVLAR